MMYNMVSVAKMGDATLKINILGMNGRSGSANGTDPGMKRKSPRPEGRRLPRNVS
jgi:hypothetical protein